MAQRLASALLVVLLTGVGCATSEEEASVDLGVVEGIAGLVGVATTEDREPPGLVAGFSPELPESLATQLEESAQVRIVIRVVVGPDGAPIGVKVSDVRPARSDAAAQYAELVSAAAWKWRYKPSPDGTAVLDLTFEP